MCPVTYCLAVRLRGHASAARPMAPCHAALCPISPCGLAVQMPVFIMAMHPVHVVKWRLLGKRTIARRCHVTRPEIAAVWGAHGPHLANYVLSAHAISPPSRLCGHSSTFLQPCPQKGAAFPSGGCSMINKAMGDPNQTHIGLVRASWAPAGTRPPTHIHTNPPAGCQLQLQWERTRASTPRPAPMASIGRASTAGKRIPWRFPASGAAAATARLSRGFPPSALWRVRELRMPPWPC